MALKFPEIRVGEPLRHETLSVFPLFTKSTGGVEYRLSTEALADETVVVEEVDETGSVPDLLVENKGETRVLFIEGEELVGAKQNRILNASVLIPAKSKVKIPVSCVERGRWAYTSQQFQSSGSHSPSKLRYAMKSSVSASLTTGRGHQSDQGAVWEQVDSLLCEHSVASPSAAMSQVFDDLEDRAGEYRESLQYVEGATGVAVALGGKVVALDLFDKPETCRKVWDRLLSGCVLEALQSGSDEKPADASDVHRLLNAAGKAEWEQVEPVGEGEEFRAAFSDDHASALSFEGSVLHESVVAAR